MTSIRLLGSLFNKELPIKPPVTPPRTIKGSIFNSKGVKPVATCVVNRDDNCEKKIMKIELILASLNVIEKPIVKTATLNGPPPIPKKVAIIPSNNPIIKMAVTFSI